MFASSGAVIFSFHGFNLYWYGVILAIAILVGINVSNFFAERYYKSSFVLDSAPLVIILGVVFARFYYCVLNYKYYFSSPLEILAIRHGGLAIHGAVLGGILGLLTYFFLNKEKFKLGFLQITDVYALGLPLGQAIGRWGNFFNSEAFGTPCDLPWKLFIPVQNRPLAYIDNPFFHPTFLYESLLDLFIFFVLVHLFKKHSIKGLTTALYLIFYGVCRLFVEFFRTDSILSIGFFHVAQVASLLMIILGAILLFLVNRKV